MKVGDFSYLCVGFYKLISMYSKKAIEYSNVILSALAANDGKMRESDVLDILDEKYGEETDEPALQIESLIATEQMIVREKAYLILTKEGRKAAKSGLQKFLKREDMLDRVRENKDIVGYAIGIGTLVGYLVNAVIYFILM